MEPAAPYLSVVVTSRNDDHGSGMLRRMQTFVNCFINQCKRHQLAAELIFVEWNPPADRPRLAQALTWPEDLGPCAVRIIEVPPAIHQRFEHAEALPLFQMIAKNVGIRRARGQYVLATNIDILMSDELFELLVRRQLRPGRMYRIDRTDVMADVPVNAPVDEQLAYCETHRLRINAREGIYRLTPDELWEVYAEDVADQGAGLYLGEGWFAPERYEGELYRWVGEDAEFAVQAPPDLARPLCLTLESGPGVNYGTLHLQVQDTQGRTVAEGTVEHRQRVYFRLPLRPGEINRFRLHTVGKPPLEAYEPDTLNFRVFRCEWRDVPASARAATPGHNFWTEYVGSLRSNDIATPESGIRFARGWHPPETYAGEHYRWVGEDAVLVVDPPAPGTTCLRLVTEPGPGVGYRPFELRVRDEQDRVVARGTLRGRQRVLLTLPGGPETRRFRFETEGGGQTAFGDPRVLNFRVFTCDWCAAPAAAPGYTTPPGSHNFQMQDTGALLPEDIAAVGEGIAFGAGWYAPERYMGTFYRWAGEDAAILLQGPCPSDRALALEVEPGPGVAFAAFTLELRRPDGTPVARGRVQGRQRLYFTVPPVPQGEECCLRLHVPGGGLPTGWGDPRTLNFRTFSCTWATPPATAVTPPDHLHCTAEDVEVLDTDDVAPADASIRFGPGWHWLEAEAERRCRWVGDEAVLHVTPPEASGTLVLDLEPGPGVGRGAFTLEAHGPDGLLGRVEVEARRHAVHLPLALPPGQKQTVRLVALGGGRPNAWQGDRRILNYRVWGCRWAADRRAGVEPRSLVERVGSAFRAVRDELVDLWSVLRGTDVAIVTELNGPHVGAELPSDRVAPVDLAEDDEEAAVVGGKRIDRPLLLHINNCGDFTLMARQHWFDLHGYPEFEMYSLHIDYLFCHMAHHAGAREEVWRDPIRVYHIEHSVGSGWTPEGAGLLMQRMRARGIPVLDDKDVYRWATRMRRQNKPMIFNDADWGLADVELHETVLGQSLPRAAA